MRVTHASYRTLRQYIKVSGRKCALPTSTETSSTTEKEPCLTFCLYYAFNCRYVHIHCAQAHIICF